ncbi:hypothetical protein HHL11_01875 [Ramlibacter sp. G-1-2-2]|uniref:DUF4148 domain-containing protein n=1 Tax=Ramlibacter agri TaxID=2728837 RepID=A0A848GYV1_9BURK|nr:hypothetical protein [Ramlibacter agri]NML42479.1 hypothetical protein [Ramlibacter agri]
MQYPSLVRVAALLLPAALLSSGAVWAQSSQPSPTVMTDTAPMPAQERSSNGAVIMMDQPVLAQREAMAQAQARAPDTTALGAGPATMATPRPQVERVFTEQEVQRLRREAQRENMR